MEAWEENSVSLAMILVWVADMKLFQTMVSSSIV